MTARYAIYFAPTQDSPWWAFGAGWLGRDEFANTPLPRAPFIRIADVALAT